MGACAKRSIMFCLYEYVGGNPPVQLKIADIIESGIPEQDFATSLRLYSLLRIQLC